MWLRSLRAVYRLLTLPFRGLADWFNAGSPIRRLTSLALVAVVLAGCAVLYAWSGLVSISASSGHAALTDWFLHFTMRSAVRTQSMGIKPPPLDDEKLILKGAGHYATGCMVCHGGPGEAQSLIVRQMTPEPPYLPPRIARWEPNELFWIVKNGIKFTAMPAWPALERDDEIWAVVAFIRQLPDMSETRFKELAIGPGQASATDPLRPAGERLEPVVANCMRCHGADGLGRGPGEIPKLAGQREAYLLASLQAYANGERESGIMQPVAAALEDDMLAEVARYYAALPARRDDNGAGTHLAAGRQLAEQGVADRGVPSCAQCHGPKRGPRNRHYPNIAGQNADYLALQLRLFRDGQRGGSRYAPIMQEAAHRLTDEQIALLSTYYAALPWQATLPAEAPVDSASARSPER